MRIGSVYAAHKRSLEVFFSNSMPSHAEYLHGADRLAAHVEATAKRRHSPGTPLSW